jgi:hypothetical protein
MMNKAFCLLLLLLLLLSPRIIPCPPRTQNDFLPSLYKIQRRRKRARTHTRRERETKKERERERLRSFFTLLREKTRAAKYYRSTISDVNLCCAQTTLLGYLPA